MKRVPAALVSVVFILSAAMAAAAEGGDMQKKIVKTNAEWKKLLSSEAFHVLREKGTEAPFTGKYHASKEKGTYHCAACGLELFSSETKFDSGTGWPSFWKPADAKNITTEEDGSFSMKRTEVRCARCGSHLGHVFDDGPAPTGRRYCINSVSLEMKSQGRNTGKAQY